MRLTEKSRLESVFLLADGTKIAAQKVKTGAWHLETRSAGPVPAEGFCRKFKCCRGENKHFHLKEQAWCGSVRGSQEKVSEASYLSPSAQRRRHLEDSPFL